MGKFGIQNLTDSFAYNHIFCDGCKKLKTFEIRQQKHNPINFLRVLNVKGYRHIGDIFAAIQDEPYIVQ